MKIITFDIIQNRAIFNHETVMQLERDASAQGLNRDYHYSIPTKEILESCTAAFLILK